MSWVKRLVSRPESALAAVAILAACVLVALDSAVPWISASVLARGGAAIGASLVAYGALLVRTKAQRAAAYLALILLLNGNLLLGLCLSKTIHPTRDLLLGLLWGCLVVAVGVLCRRACRDKSRLARASAVFVFVSVALLSPFLIIPSLVGEPPWNPVDAVLGVEYGIRELDVGGIGHATSSMPLPDRIALFQAEAPAPAFEWAAEPGNRVIGLRAVRDAVRVLVCERSSADRAVIKVADISMSGHSRELCTLELALYARMDLVNALTPDGSRFALDGGRIFRVDQCPDRSEDEVFPGSQFLMWCNSDRCAFYVDETNEVLVVDEDEQEIARHALKWEPRHLTSISVSSNLRRVVYLRSQEDSFCWEDLESSEYGLIPVRATHVCRVDRFPAWVNPSSFVYIGVNHRLCGVDVGTGQVKHVSELLDVVETFTYDEGSGRLLWVVGSDTARVVKSSALACSTAGIGIPSPRPRGSARDN